MAINTTTSLSNQYQRFYSKMLLETAQHNLVYNQFAKKADLPRGLGSKTIRFFRRVAAASANVQTLVEGTPITVFTDLSYTPVDADLAQLGEAVKYSDLVGWTALLNVLKDGISLMGEDCALKADDVTLAVLAHQTTGATKRYSGGAANMAALVALSAANGKYASTDGLDAVTYLKIQKAPRINGVYIGIVGPQVARDLMRDATWVNASTYSAVRQLFRGEIGELDGIRYVEHTNPWGEIATEGTRDTSAPVIWVSTFTGRDAYGVVELSGQSPFRPQVTIVDKADKADPLNQTLIAGWKAFYIAVMLNPAFAVNVRSRTAYV